MSTLRWCVRHFSALALAVMPNQDTWRREAEVTSARLGRIHRGGRGGFALISLMRYGQQSRMAEREEAKVEPGRMHGIGHGIDEADAKKLLLIQLLSSSIDDRVGVKFPNGKFLIGI